MIRYDTYAVINTKTLTCRSCRYFQVEIHLLRRREVTHTFLLALILTIKIKCIELKNHDHLK